MSALLDEVLEGGCNCGAVRYTLSPGMRIGPYACHCTDCQTRTGSAFSEHMMVLRANIAGRGEQDVGQTPNASGALVTLFGCPQCGARLWGENASRPGFATVRCGTLDRSNELVPVAHIWVASRQPWVRLPEGVLQMDRQPTSAEEWMSAMGHAP